jgi:amidohydrolase
LVPGALPSFDHSGDPAEEQAMPTSLPEFLDGWLAAHAGEVIAARRHIHANPRLSRQEHDTANYVAAALAEAGLDPQLIPDGTGLTCDIGTGDRVIAIRADMDALPIHDPKQVPYRSTVEGVCHACGHDAHTAMLIGLGRVLAELDRREGLPGEHLDIHQGNFDIDETALGHGIRVMTHTVLAAAASPAF